MKIKTKRWNDEVEADDGWRILICRYRPRALPKSKETWDNWFNQLGPSVELHNAAYGKKGKTPLNRNQYKKRYLKEIKSKEARDMITCLARVVAAGKTITLLCSSACTNETDCHRSLLRKVIADEASLL